MHEVSAVWQQIYAQPDHRKEISVTVNGVEYYEGRILNTAPSVSGKLFDAPSVGNARSRTLTLNLMPYNGPQGSIPPMSEIRLYVRLISADGQRVSEWIPKGVFYADEVKRDSDTGATRITAFDAIMKMERQFGNGVCRITFDDGFKGIQRFIRQIGDALPTPDTPTHEGQRFIAWYPNPADTETVVRDMLFTAEWARKFTVTFNSGSGTPQTFYCFAGDATPTPTTPTKSGYVFVEWTPTPAATVTADAAYFAKWLQIVASGDYWTLFEDGTLIINFPDTLPDGMTAEDVWRQILAEIAPYADDIIKVIINGAAPTPEILAELIAMLPNLKEIVLPPGIDLEELLELIDSLTVIQIVSYPTIADYAVNETLDYTGLQVVKRLPGGTETDITDDCVLLPAEGTLLTEAGDIMVDVRYEDKSLGTFWVEVSTVILKSLVIASYPTKTAYTVGETLDYTGLSLTATYSDGTTQTVTAADCTLSPVEGTEITATGTIAVTASYGGKTATFDVTATVESTQIIASGDWWTLYGNGLLHIYCVGDMPDYPDDLSTWPPQYNYGPWYSYRTSVRNVTISDSVTSIGENAFYFSGLTSVTIPNSVTKIGHYAFIGCSGLTSVTIPNSVTEIVPGAFMGCSGLTSVTIPNSVTVIANSTFASCSALTSVTIPNGVTEIGATAFQGCRSLTSVTIPSSVTSIISRAFENCSALTSVTIPNGVTRIYLQTFKGCSALTGVTIPNGVTVIGSSAFEDCSRLTSVTIPDSVTYIDNSAFSGCSSLTSVTIPNSVTNIGANVFSNCSALASVTMPNSVTSGALRIFYNCSSLTSVTIPNGITVIQWSAFEGCSSLRSVTIPNSVTSIEDSAFYGCNRLADIYYNGTQAQWNAITIESGNSALTSATIHYDSSGPS